MKLLTISFAVGALAIASPAFAQVRAQDIPGVARALQTAGYSTEVGVDGIGDPMITSTVAGARFQVFFYNCTNHADCATVQFHIGYVVNPKVSASTMDAWNGSQRFGRAHLDKDGDPILEMDLDLDDGGISQALFEDNLEFWSSIVPKFETHIGYRPKS